MHVGMHVLGLNGEFRQTEAHELKFEGDLNMAQGRK